jgi:protein O-GlcNAc transferase
MIEAATRPVTDDLPVVVLLQQGIAEFRRGNMPAADDIFTRVLLADPGNAHCLHMLGLVAEQRGDLEMAERLIERSIDIAPHSRAWLNLGVVRCHRGDLDAGIACYRAAIELEPDYAEAWVNLLFALDMHPEAPPDVLRAEREAFDRAACGRWTNPAPPHEVDRDPDRRLRVGYLGADFRVSHSASRSFGWIIDHDPEAVEVYLYSTHPDGDPASAPFMGMAGVWCGVAEQSDAEIAQIVREDRIDILVDLGVVSRGGRPLVFARKPAPIQVGGWGYPHGLGIKALDYLVGDPVATPPDHADHYPEQILTLPCLMGCRLEGDLPDVGESPQRRRGYRTYGYLGRPTKIDPATIGAWAEILRSDPTGRLLLKSGQYGDRRLRERVVSGLVALGVEAGRIEVRGETSRRDHLLAHREVDVTLDPLWIGGGQTVWDSLLMGVPVAAVAGETVSGRIAASVLTVSHLSAWVAPNRRGYVQTARSGASPSREWVRERAMSSIGCDSVRYARAVESAYRQVWRRWCEEGRR